MFAEIIIPIALPKNYTWSIPESLQEEIMIGMRVEVILGANKRYAGIVKKIIHQKDIPIVIFLLQDYYSGFNIV